MRVTVVDRDAMRQAWGRPGLYEIITRTIEIPNNCPVCGGPRGEPRPHYIYEDGCRVTTDVWDNPCGHVDMYSDVIKEAQNAGV